MSDLTPEAIAEMFVRNEPVVIPVIVEVPVVSTTSKGSKSTPV